MKVERLILIIIIILKKKNSAHTAKRNDVNRQGDPVKTGLCFVNGLD